MADNAIALQVQTPDSMKSIGSMLNFAGQAQQLQSGTQQIQRNSVALQQDQQDMGERNALRSLSSKLGEYKTPSGEPDYQRLADAALNVAPKHGAAWLQQIAAAHAQSTAAQSAVTKLSEEQRGAIGQVVMSVADQPANVQQEALGAVVQGNPSLKPWADIALKRLMAAGDDPAARKQVAQKLAQSTMSVGAQVEATTPGGPGFNTGQVSGIINTKPLAGPVAPVVGTLTQNTLPPTTTRFDPTTGTFTYLGANSGNGPVTAQPALGAAANVAGTVETVNKDWEATNAGAVKASQDIGVLQEIKKYAHGAVTGVANERRAFAAGLAGLLGMDVAQMEKTNTDLLAKNSNMLALAGGDTNLARTMAEAANPNNHMTEQAIHKAADQVIGQRQMALARQQYLGKFKNDPEKYTQAMTEFNKYADPRILQLANMSPTEKSKMKASMSKDEQKEFGEKIRGLYKIGILK